MVKEECLDPVIQLDEPFDGFNVSELDALRKWGDCVADLEKVPQLVRQLKSAGPSRRDEWLRNTRSCAKWRLDQTTVAFSGATGSGKSTILNALLGATIVPTHSHEACTSVPIKISYHANDDLVAVVHFMDRADFKHEIDVTLGDIGGDDTNLESPETSSAWAKIKALYPRLKNMNRAQISALKADELLNSDPDIIQFLDDRKKTIRKPDPVSFAAAVHPFLSPEPMSSTLGSDKRALWPLVCKVDIHYKSPILARGLSLVDLPGGGDSNKARTRVAEEYLNRCDHLMIVSTSVRPGSEATAHDLMNKAFCARLRSGRYTAGFLACIVTKTDDLSPEEIIRSMGLSKDPWLQELEEDIRCTVQNIKVRKQQLYGKRANGHTDIQEAILELQDEMSECDETTSEEEVSIGVKRYHPTNRSGSTEKRVRINTAASSRTSPPGSMHDSRDHLRRDYQKKAAKVQKHLAQLEKQLQELRGSRIMYCARKRETNTRELLIRNFHQELKDVTETLNAEHGEIPRGMSVESDVDDPSVFCTSARDYSRLKGIIQDEPASTFLEEEETGVPALRAYLTDLTRPRYRASLEDLKYMLNSLTASLTQYIVTESAEEQDEKRELKKAMIGQWDSAYHLRTVKGELGPFRQFDQLLAPRLKIVLKAIVEHRAFDWRTLFTKRLTANTTKASKDAAKEAPQAIKIALEKIRFPTLGAICRRDGEFKCHDLNDLLSQPFVRRILKEWQSLFKTKMFNQLKQDALEVLQIVLDDVLKDVLLKGPIVSETRRKLQAARELAEDCLDRLLQAVDKTLQSNQLTLSREVVPYIQEVMVPAYEATLAETGRGSLARRRGVLHAFVVAHADELYTGSAEVLNEGLQKAISQIEESVNCRLEQIAEEVESVVTSAWQLPRDNLEERTAELDLQALATSMKLFVDSLPADDQLVIP